MRPLFFSVPRIPHGFTTGLTMTPGPWNPFFWRSVFIHSAKALTRLSLFAGVDLTNLLYLNIFALKGLHYIAATATTGETREAVILGGGCAGSRNRNASRSRRCSGSGCV